MAVCRVVLCFTAGAQVRSANVLWRNVGTRWGMLKDVAKTLEHWEHLMNQASKSWDAVPFVFSLPLLHRTLVPLYQ